MKSNELEEILTAAYVRQEAYYREALRLVQSAPMGVVLRLAGDPPFHRSPPRREPGDSLGGRCLQLGPVGQEGSRCASRLRLNNERPRVVVWRSRRR